MDRPLLSLIIAGGAFCGSHILLSSTRLRGSLRDQLGERGFLAVYSVTSLVIFAWFVAAYSAAATMDRARPGVGDAARNDLAGRRLYDAQPNGGRHGAIGPGGRSGPRHPVRDAPPGHVGDRAMGDQSSDRQRRCEFGAVFRLARRFGAGRDGVDRPQEATRTRQQLAAAD